MAYEVTATRRRPRTFDALVGQDFVVATLKNSVVTGRIAHAYLFCGPRGVGKTSAARILARALNCPGEPSAEGCEDYPGSEEIARGTSLDVIEIDGASNTSVNDVRQIKDEVLFAPNSSRYKIYIIDEVHMLSNSAFNALLKTIEEPPPYIIFIFATTEVHKVPATIRSRCQQFNFRLIPSDTIISCLRDACAELGVEAEEDALFWIAKEGAGSLRDAYTIFDQVAAFSDGKITLAEIRSKLGLLGVDRISAIAEAMAASDAARVLELAEEIVSGGVSIDQFVVDLAEYFRSLLFLRHGVEKESLLGFRVASFPEHVRTAFTPAQIEKAIELLLTLYRNLRYTLNPRFELELVLARLSDLAAYISAQDISRGISRIREEILQGRFAGGGTPASGEHPKTPPAEPAAVSRPGTPSTGAVRTPARSIVSQTNAPSSATATSSHEGPVSATRAPARNTRVAEDPSENVSDDDDHEAIDARVDESSDSGGAAGPADETFRQIVSHVRKKKLTLGAILEKATDWKLSEDELIITFESAYSANTVRQDAQIVITGANEVLGERSGGHLRLRVGIANQNAGSEERRDARIEMVKDVFRGEIVP